MRKRLEQKKSEKGRHGDRSIGTRDRKKGGTPKRTFRFTSILEQSDNRLWGGHFRVPDTIVRQLSQRNSRRIVCTLNGTAEYQTALLPHSNGSFVVRVNKNLRDRLGLSFGADVSAILKKDESEYGLPLPDELRELLRQDAEGNALFHALTRGKQRTLLYIAGSIKDSEKRIQRAIVIVNHLKVNKGKINYRQLGASLKDPRLRSGG